MSRRQALSPKAFTIVELLVVIAISALFSAIAITYSSIGRNQLSLSVEASKISQSILQAKALSIATYTSNSASCGFGVQFDVANQNYSIFAYSPAGAPPCPSVGTIANLDNDYLAQYTAATWKVPIATGVKFTGANGEMAILFYPPDPTVFLSGDGTNFQSGTLDIGLSTTDGKNSVTLAVNPEGQVSF